MKLRTLHIGSLSPLLLGFWDFLETELEPEGHLLLYAQASAGCEPTASQQRRLVRASRRGLFFAFCRYAYQAEQIVIHGLFDYQIMMALFLQPWLLGKTYWIVWGNDLYRHIVYARNWKWRLKEFIRRPVIRGMGHIVTGTPGDFALAQKWYGARGRHIRCYNYPSNLFKTPQVEVAATGTLNLLIGNSADPLNRHRDSLQALEAFKDQNIRIYCPLSYGDQAYARELIAQGRARFGDKFVPLTEFMPLNDYVMLLNQIEIAIFAHEIQQAFGNMITLLGLGKKVFLKRCSTLWPLFEELGLRVFDFAALDLSPLSPEVAEQNRRIVSERFSRESLRASLRAWLKQAS